MNTARTSGNARMRLLPVRSRRLGAAAAVRMPESYTGATDQPVPVPACPGGRFPPSTIRLTPWNDWIIAGANQRTPIARS
jgi:hypothetical protein